MGEVISALAREALLRPSSSSSVRNGVPLLHVQRGAVSATLAQVNQLHDELP